MSEVVDERAKSDRFLSDRSTPRYLPNEARHTKVD